VYVLAESFDQFLDKLHDRPKFDPDEMDQYAANNDLINVARLLDLGWDIEKGDYRGFRLLDWASMHQKKELVALLLERGAKISRSLDLAINARNPELIDLIRSYEDKG